MALWNANIPEKRLCKAVKLITGHTKKMVSLLKQKLQGYLDWVLNAGSDHIPQYVVTAHSDVFWEGLF